MRMTTGASLRFAIAMSCMTVVLALGFAEAQASDDIPKTRGMMEYKLGPYLPMVDAEFDNGPYQEFFGDSSMLHGEIAIDYHLWQRVGKLSLGLHAGYGRVRGVARDAASGTEVESDDQASFRIIPLRTSLVYRYDYSAHRHNIPLVPVLKAGLNYNFWRAKDPGGDTSVVGDSRGSGGKPGWHVTTGLHLHLDFLDRSSAAAFDMTWGIANSYLFFEHTWTRMLDDGIDLGANHWAIGLAFEF